MHVKGLSRNQIKYIVIMAMLIDHIAWAFVPTKSVQGVAMHFIGRLTGPTMAYLLADGFLYTSSKAKYALRLGIFALLSWMPFSLFEKGRWPTANFGVIYSLLLGFIALWIWNNEKLHQAVKIAGIAAVLVLSTWGDWAYMDIFIPLIAFKFRDDEQTKWRGITIMCAVWAVTSFMGGIHQGILQSGILMVPLLLRFGYNGKLGSRHPLHKWFFYVFYPTHLLILALIKYNTIRIFGSAIDLPWK